VEEHHQFPLPPTGAGEVVMDDNVDDDVDDDGHEDGGDGGQQALLLLPPLLPPPLPPITYHHWKPSMVIKRERGPQRR